MAESNYRDHIQDKTRLQDKNCCLRYPSCKMGKKKNKNTKCTMLLYFFGFLRLFSFHYVFLMCFMSTGDRSYLIPACPG